ncbi:hypothetical protein ACSZND_24165, partial [Aeromonas hydrophila]
MRYVALAVGLALWGPVLQAETLYTGDKVQGVREFNFEVQFPIKNQAAFRSSSKTTCGCLNPKH